MTTKGASQLIAVAATTALEGPNLDDDRLQRSTAASTANVTVQRGGQADRHWYIHEIHRLLFNGYERIDRLKDSRCMKTKGASQLIAAAVTSALESPNLDEERLQRSTAASTANVTVQRAGQADRH